MVVRTSVVVVSISLLVVTAGASSLAAYYDHLRWARRESFLHSGPAQENSKPSDALERQIAALTDEIHALRAALDRPRDERRLFSRLLRHSRP